MLIFSMTATFGCLNNQTLRLHDGLNLLEEANEGGKSTWCAFLRAMFYGLESRKGGALSERNRYTPWSGAAMRGEMELSWQGRHITLRRFPKGANPFGGFQAVYTGTEEPVPGLSADNVGETILGVSKEVFQRTSFIPQGGLQIDGAADLEKRVAALATSGLEEVSFSETERRLKDWRNGLQSNRSTGLLPRLRQRLDQQLAQREKANALRARVEEAQQALTELETQREEVNADLARHEALQREDFARRYEDARRQLEEKQAQYDRRAGEAALRGALPSQEALRKAQGDLAYLGALRGRLKPAQEAIAAAEETLRAARAELDASPLSPLTAPEAEEEGRKALELLSHPAATKAWHWAPVLGGAAAALALILVGLITKAIHLAIVLGVGGGVLAVGIVLSLCFSIHGRKSRKRAIKALLERFGTEDEEDVTRELKRYQTLLKRRQEAELDLTRALSDHKALEGEYDGLWESLTAFCQPFAPEVHSPVTLSAALSRALAQDGMLAQARGELEAAQAVFNAVSAQGAPMERGASPGENPNPLPTEEPKRELSEDNAMLNRLNHAIALYADQLARSKGELAGLGDAAEAEEALNATRERLTVGERQYQALTAAMECLSEANATLQNRFSPAVNQAAGEIMARLTGGRYTALSFTREFQALADSGLGPHVSQLLSQGTADQAYLALRLAICRLTFFQEELPPLVLDDALVTFDDRRLGYALELLEELGRDRQVLLFTCQSRERQALVSRGGSGREAIHLS